MTERSTRERILAEARLRSELPLPVPLTFNATANKSIFDKPWTIGILVLVFVGLIGQYMNYCKIADVQDKVFMMQLSVNKMEKDIKRNVKGTSDIVGSLSKMDTEMKARVEKMVSTALQMAKDLKANEVSLKNDIIRLNEASVTLKNDAQDAKMIMTEILEIHDQTSNQKCKIKVDEYVNQVTNYLKNFNDKSD